MHRIRFTEREQGGIFMANPSSAGARGSNRSGTVKLTVTAVLTALILVMTFTPIGYLKVGAIEITFLSIPVAIGAIICGPGAGAFLGAVFGATSFLQCFTAPTPFSAALLGISPLRTAVMCFVPRILAGLLTGLIFTAFRNKKSVLSFTLSSFSMGFLNTVFFVAALILLFGTKSLAALQLGDTVVAIISTLVTVNALVEWAACLVIGFAVSKALAVVLKKYMK